MTFSNQIKNTILNAYSGIRREMWLLAVAMLINRSGSMVLLFMSVYLTKEKHFSIEQAGIILSLFGVGSLVGAFVGGKLVDRFGFYPILIWSLVLSGCMIIALSFVANFYLIGTLTFLVTSTGDAFRPANSASISAYSDAEHYAQSIALNRLAMNIGFTIGPMLGGFLAHYSYTFLFWADGITCILAACFIYLFLPYRTLDKKTTGAKSENLSPYRDKHYLFFLLLTCLYAMSFFQLLTTLPLYYKNVYLLSERNIGWLMALNGIGVAVIEMFLIYYIKNRWQHFQLIGWGVLLLIAAFVSLVLTKSIWILVLNIVLLTFSEMLAMPFMSTHSLQRAQNRNTGDYMALYSMSWSIALILAPLLGSQIIAWQGYQALWLSIAGCGVLTWFGFKVLAKQE